MRKFIAIAAACLIAASASGGEAKAAKKSAKKADATKAAKKTAAGEAVADAETAALLDKMESLKYCVTKEGAKTVSCNGTSTMQVTGQPPSKGAFRYVLDSAAKDGKGKVTYVEGAALPPGMSPSEVLDDQLKDVPWKKRFAGCKLSTVKEGGKTIIRVDGTNPEYITAMTVNAEGLPGDVEMNLPGIGKATAKTEFAKVKDKFVATKNTLLASNGVTLADLAVEFTDAGEYRVPAKANMTLSVPVKTDIAMTFSDYKFNEPAGTAPEGKGKKAEKAAGKAAAPKKKA